MGALDSITTFKKIEDTVLEFIEEEVERRTKSFSIILEINSQQVDIDETHIKDGIIRVRARYLKSDQNKGE